LSLLPPYLPTGSKTELPKYGSAIALVNVFTLSGEL